MLGIAVVIGSAGTNARAEDDDDALPDVKLFRSVLKALGLRRDDEGIDYRERSPLVIPPRQTLPPPETGTPAQRAAAWPDDPDVKRAKERREARRKASSHVEGVDDRPLLPNELGPRTPPRRQSSEGAPKSFEESARPSTPAELGAKNVFTSIWRPAEEYGTFAGEPPRTSLIEPPAGYRTPSPNQPYGIGKQKWKPPVIDPVEPAR
jgi:hypothetical protein